MAGDDLKDLQRRLKEAGERGLSRELNKSLNTAVKPLKMELPKSARRVLPSRGGLAERIAKSKISIRKKPNGLVLVAKNDYQLAKMDNPGVIRKPVFPRRSRLQRVTGRNKGRAKLQTNRKKWAWESQRIKPGWFSEPTARAGKQITTEVENAVKAVARQIEGR